MVSTRSKTKKRKAMEESKSAKTVKTDKPTKVAKIVETSDDDDRDDYDAEYKTVQDSKYTKLGEDLANINETIASTKAQLVSLKRQKKDAKILIEQLTLDLDDLKTQRKLLTNKQNLQKYDEFQMSVINRLRVLCKDDHCPSIILCVYEELITASELAYFAKSELDDFYKQLFDENGIFWAKNDVFGDTNVYDFFFEFLKHKDALDDQYDNEDLSIEFISQVQAAIYCKNLFALEHVVGQQDNYILCGTQSHHFLFGDILLGDILQYFDHDIYNFIINNYGAINILDFLNRDTTRGPTHFVTIFRDSYNANNHEKFIVNSTQALNILMSKIPNDVDVVSNDAEVINDSDIILNDTVFDEIGNAVGYPCRREAFQVYLKPIIQNKIKEIKNYKIILPSVLQGVLTSLRFPHDLIHLINLYTCT